MTVAGQASRWEEAGPNGLVWDVRMAKGAEVIHQLWSSGPNDEARHLQLGSSASWEPPRQQLELGVAASEPQSAPLAGGLAGRLIAVEPSSEVAAGLGPAGGTGKPTTATFHPASPVARDEAISSDGQGDFTYGWRKERGPDLWARRACSS